MSMYLKSKNDIFRGEERRFIKNYQYYIFTKIKEINNFILISSKNTYYL